MTTSLKDILDALPAERRDRILKRANALVDEDAELQAALDAEEAAERALWTGPLSFSVNEDRGAGFRFSVLAANGEPLIDSVAFADKAKAFAAMKSFHRRLIEAHLPEDADAVA